MSLEDRFNQNNGSFIDRLHQSLVTLHQKLGDFYQNKTHKSADALKSNLYGISSACLLTYEDPTRMLLFPAIANTWMYATDGGYPKADLEGRAICEAAGFPSSGPKWFHAALYGIGIASTALDCTRIGTGITTGNALLTKHGLQGAGFSLGMMAWATANYLHHCNFAPPPQPRSKSPKETDQDLREIIHLPEPQPIPVHRQVPYYGVLLNS